MRARRAPIAAVGTVVLVVVATGLWLNWSPPTLSRQTAIGLAVHGTYPRVEAKLIHRSDLSKVTSEMTVAGTNPWDRVWVIAVSGDYGVQAAASRTTWGVAILP